MINSIRLDTDDQGIWLINDSHPNVDLRIGHVSWKEITRGVQQALLQEKFLIALAEIDGDLL